MGSARFHCANKLIINNEVYVLNELNECEFCNIGDQTMCDYPLFDEIKTELS